MNARHGGLITLALLASLCLASCGGSGSDNVAGGGIGGTGYVSTGTVTGLGSIMLNGVDFDTGNALVIIGGRQAGTGNLAVLGNLDLGQVVVVEGTVDDSVSSGTASSVRYTPHVKGPVAEIISIDPTIKRVMVLEQTVIIDDSTSLRDTTAGDIAVNNLIEVSGLVDGAGVVRATHVKKKGDSFNSLTEVEVKGIVQDLEAAERTFRLNALVVYFGQADVGRLPGGTPEAGQLVHVRGTVGAGGRLEATEVGLSDESRIAGADRLDVEGLVTEFLSTSDFKVGFVRVQARGDTNFIGGRMEEVEKDVRIQVRGRIVNGILVAEQIFFNEKVQLESRVSSKESGSKTLSLTGLEKITVTATSLTKIGRVAKEFDDIQVGDYVRIRGRVRTDASVVATRVEVIQSPQDPDLIVLQGPVEAVSKPALVILGVTVDTSTISDNNFYGVGGTDKRAMFFQKVQPGDLVKAEGRMGTGGQVVWEGITLQKGS